MTASAKAEDGSELWLRYRLPHSPARLAEYRRTIRSIDLSASSPTLAAAGEELTRGLRGMLGVSSPTVSDLREGTLIVSTAASSKQAAALSLANALRTARPEGYVIRTVSIVQEREARWWRDAELSYFQTLSQQPISPPYEKPAHDLPYYQGVTCPADRSKPRCDGVP